MSKMGRLRTTLALGAAALLGLGSVADAQSLNLSRTYLTRLGSVSVVASSTEGFGVRNFPLPTGEDIRFTVVRNTQYDYWDYGLTGQFKNLRAAAGVFSSVPKAELTYDQRDGMVGSVLIQGRNYAGLAYHSHLYAGYSFTTDSNRVRILNVVGVAEQEVSRKGEKYVLAPYLRSEMTTSHSAKFGVFNARLSTLGRLYAYPDQGTAQLSADVTPGVSVAPVPGLLLDASHLSRMVTGTSPIRDFNLVNLQQSTLIATYRLPVGKTPPAVMLGGLRGRLVRNWTNDYTYAYGDVFIRLDALPVMLGPSIGYQWTPGGRTDKWVFSLVTLPR